MRHFWQPARPWAGTFSTYKAIIRNIYYSAEYSQNIQKSRQWEECRSFWCSATLYSVKWTYQSYEDVPHKVTEQVLIMVNPQESLDQGILTQFSELSDLSSDQSAAPTKLAPKKLVMKSGNKLLHVQMGINTPSSTSSSSPSFKSPGSASTLSLITQVDDSKTVVVNEDTITKIQKILLLCRVIWST